MLAASLDNSIGDHMDTIHWSDLLSTNAAYLRGSRVFQGRSGTEPIG